MAILKMCVFRISKEMNYILLILLLATEDQKVCGCTKVVVKFHTYLLAHKEAHPWKIACTPFIWVDNKKNYEKTIQFHSFCEEMPMHLLCAKYILWLSSKLMP